MRARDSFFYIVQVEFGVQIQSKGVDSSHYCFIVYAMFMSFHPSAV